MIIRAAPLTTAAYASYGDVLSADRDDVVDKAANQGTARRRDWLGDLVNNRADARANIASFRCVPRTQWPMQLALLEKHPHSTQVFVPMNAKRYLVLVALGGDAPDLSTLRAFEATPTQGVSYRPGVWHHPMIALDAPTDFTVLVFEDGSEQDCVTIDLRDRGVTIEL